MLGAGLLISSLLTLFTPLTADFGVILVIVIRTVQGMAQVTSYFLILCGIQVPEFYWRSSLTNCHFRVWHGQVSLQFGQNGLLHLNEASSPALRDQVRMHVWITTL